MFTNIQHPSDANVTPDAEGTSIAATVGLIENTDINKPFKGVGAGNRRSSRSWVATAAIRARQQGDVWARGPAWAASPCRTAPR